MYDVNHSNLIHTIYKAGLHKLKNKTRKIIGWFSFNQTHAEIIHSF